MKKIWPELSLIMHFSSWYMIHVKKIIQQFKRLSPFLDIVFLPLVIIIGVYFRLIKFLGFKNFRITKRVLLKIGVMPLVNHYYEPFYYHLKFEDTKRSNHHLKVNLTEQIAFLDKVCRPIELQDIPLHSSKSEAFFYNNNTFSVGDADLYYHMIRYTKPTKVIEVGSGFSTLIAKKAVDRNNSEGTRTVLSCIEPYEHEWLNRLGIDVIREKVENIGLSFFTSLNENDILFIDSSHIIRPGGDVLAEMFEILPILKKGVYIHFHDIFFPNHYPDQWINDELRIWNEQYLLEAFLSYNDSFQIVASLNYLTNEKFLETQKFFPKLERNLKPSSFWIKKV